jgi:hypothetical protein
MLKVCFFIFINFYFSEKASIETEQQSLEPPITKGIFYFAKTDSTLLLSFSNNFSNGAFRSSLI